MPELPEVESLRKSLEPFILNQKIISVVVKNPKLVSSNGTKRFPDENKVKEFETQLSGQRVTKISRIAKHIIIETEVGRIMVVHLKMTGQMVFVGKKSDGKASSVIGGHPIIESEILLPNKHTYITFELENGNLYYNDVRMFGYCLYFENMQKAEELINKSGYGIDPLSKEFTLKNFEAKLKTKTGILKKVFLEQKVVTGLGNIYADEVAFASGVMPSRTVKSLKNAEIKAIYESVKRIIPKAVELGGSSVSDYLLADGSRGNYAREHKVYKRANLPCKTCGDILKKMDLAGRTTVYCPSCQS